jgi:hypothetical protein
MLVYFRLPSGLGTCFCIFVLTLSKGREKHEATVPETILAQNQAFEMFLAYRASLVMSLDTSIPRLRDMALTTVGVAPFQHARRPSFLTIELKAWITFL